MKKIKIGWLYPTLMNVYGDIGNIKVLQKRLEWRKIDSKILYLDLGFKITELDSCDILIMGGAQDRQQTIVAKDLSKKKKTLFEKIESGIPGLYICGAYQFLGHYYKGADGNKIEGLGIFDLYTENLNQERLIGNLAAQSEIGGTLIGFENHGGRTYLGQNIKPLAKVINGFGNNGNDKTEGAIYKNSIGTYLHGPILPKNPRLADYLLEIAVGEKLEPLDDDLENKARKVIAKRLNVEI